MSDKRLLRVASGRELEIIDALMAASKQKNAMLVEALVCLRALKVLVDGVCWGDRDEATLKALEQAAETYQLKAPK